MTDLLILGSVSLILLSVMGVLFAVFLRQSVRDFARMSTELDVRRQAEVQSLLNRLMTIRWEDFITVEETESAEEGGFYPPEHGSEDETLHGGQWGALSQTRRRADVLDDNEKQLLLEDFPEDK